MAARTARCEASSSTQEGVGIGAVSPELPKHARATIPNEARIEFAHEDPRSHQGDRGRWLVPGSWLLSAGVLQWHIPWRRGRTSEGAEVASCPVMSSRRGSSRLDQRVGRAAASLGEEGGSCRNWKQASAARWRMPDIMSEADPVPGPVISRSDPVARKLPRRVRCPGPTAPRRTCRRRRERAR